MVSVNAKYSCVIQQEEAVSHELMQEDEQIQMHADMTYWA